MNRTADWSLRRFWHPRFWPTWILLGGLRGLALLPFRVQVAIGKALGKTVMRLRRRDVRVAWVNLELCFPGLTDAELEALVDKHLVSVGLSLVATAIAWFWPLEKLRRLVVVEGIEHLDAALARGRGALLVAAHFTSIEIGGAILEGYDHDVSCMYRPQRNAMMDALVLRGRSRFARDQIARDDVRHLLKRLRANEAVFYLPDQTYLGNQSALLPFFGVPAVTNTATSRLAEISGAAVLPYFYRRASDDSGYIVEIMAPLEDFPTADRIHDTLRLVAILEDRIRRVPDQYLWLYKKFKRRPKDLPDPYR